MPQDWFQMVITVGGIVVAAIVQSFWIGKKFGDLRSDIRSLAEENEHCNRDRHSIRGHQQAISSKVELHSIELATLKAQAPTWRLHKETGGGS
jgi:hypothetical protein